MSYDVDRDAVAVIGYAGRFPGARDVAEFWQNLLAGVESISFFNDEELRGAGVPADALARPNYVRAAPVIDRPEWIDAALFGISARDAEILDPQHRVFLETVYSAFQHAGYDPFDHPEPIGVFAGTRHNEYIEGNVYRNPATVRAVGGLMALVSNHTDYLATRVAYQLGLRGPALSVATACSTSLVAVHLALRALRGGECSMAVAGGVEIVLPQESGYLFVDGGICAPDGRVRPFDAQARGTVFGSGCGAVIVKRLGDAVADRDTIYAVLRGSAVNNDGADKSAFSAPSRSGQIAVLEAALRDADVDPRSIGYVEAHGTGTAVGDPIEVNALREVFRRYTADTGYCVLSSVKANVGHLGAAAGVTGLIKAIECVRTGLLPPSINFERANPRIDFDDSPFVVSRDLARWQSEAGLRRAGVSSFGIGGTNAHVVVEQAPEPAPAQPSARPYQLLTVSANTVTAAVTAAENLAGQLERTPEDQPDLADVAYTLGVGRHDYPVRATVVARTAEEACERLRRLSPPVDPAPTTGEVAFVFPGQGAQHLQMALDLYQQEPIFAKRFDYCADLLAASHGLDLRAVLYPADDGQPAADRLNQTAIAQPALFTIEYALAMLLRDWGIEPAAMAGHSVGEFVAACIAGVFSLEDALRLVADRGALMQSMPAGAMHAVRLPQDLLASMLPDGVSIAAVNGPELCVMSGPASELDRLRDVLGLQGVSVQPLHVSHAFHSAMMEPILAEFGERVRAIRLSTPQIPYVSNLSGAWVEPDQATDPDYWVAQLRSCVRFADALSLLAAGRFTILEVGPGRTISASAGEGSGGNRRPTVIPTMRHARRPADDVATLLDGLGRAWVDGARLDWNRFWTGESRRRVALPVYPYERRRFWVEPVQSPAETAAAAAGAADRSPFSVPVWQESALVPPGDVTGDGVLWVVFEPDRTGPVAQFEQRLRSAGARVVAVYPASDYLQETDAVGIRGSERADYVRLYQHIASHAPDRLRLVHGWTLEYPSRTAPAAERGETQYWLDRGFFSALTALQERATVLGSTPTEVIIASSQMQDVLGDGAVVPAKAAVLGLIRLAPKEFDELTCRSVDFGQPTDTGAIAAQLYAEATAAPIGAGSAVPDQVAYRGRKRWLWSHADLRLDAPDGPPALVREGGVYLITGGLGGIGLVVADQLAQLAGARLVLLGRTGLPDKATWPAVLADPATDRRLASQIRAVQELEAAGAQLLVCAGDVTDEARMREVRAEAERTFGPVNGVFHLAAVAGGGMLETRQRDAAQRVFDPKVAGTYALHDVFGADLDFMVLYSTIAVYSGDFGLGDYAAANAVLDAFAQRQWAAGRHVVSINWPAWAEIGMTAGIDGPYALLRLQENVTAQVGHPMFHGRSGDPAGQVVLDVNVSPSLWVYQEHRVAGVPAMPGTGMVELVRAAFEEVTGNPFAEIRDLMFPNLLRVEEDLRVELTMQADGTGGYTVVVAGLGNGENRIEFARGYVTAAPVHDAPTIHDLAALRAACPVRSTPAFGPIGPMAFGPRWDAIAARYSGDGVELLDLALPAEYVADLASWKLHPAILDNANAIGHRPHGDRRFIPFAYRRIVVRGGLTPRCHSIIRYRDDRSGDILQSDIVLTDQDGTELVAIEGFMLLAVEPTAATPAPTGGSPAQPLRDVNQLLPADRAVDGVPPDEASEVLRRVLATAVGPQVIWSPIGLVEEVRATAQVNRAALTDRLASAVIGATTRPSLLTPYVAPETEIEQVLAQMWQDTLGVNPVGVDDDFFDLDGNSLIAVQLVARIGQWYTADVPLTSLFDHRTVRKLAEFIEDLLVRKVAALSDIEVQRSLQTLHVAG